MATLNAYTDGACRGGNPGRTSCGWVIYDGDTELHSGVQVMGGLSGKLHTNNEAEYQGLINLLFFLTYKGLRNVWIYSDSQLVVGQVNQEWAVNKPEFDAISKLAYGLLTRGGHKLFHVKGHDGNKGNERADQLCNEVLDKAEIPAA